MIAACYNTLCLEEIEKIFLSVKDDERLHSILPSSSCFIYTAYISLGDAIFLYERDVNAYSAL